MKKITLVGADEGAFDYNRSIDSIESVKRDVEIMLHVEMVFREGVDVVTFQVFTRYVSDKLRLLDYSVTLGFRVENWSNEVMDKSNADVLAMDEVRRMLSIAVGFLRGSLSLQTRTTPFKGAFLPLVNIDNLKKNVNVNRLKDSF